MSAGGGGGGAGFWPVLTSEQSLLQIDLPTPVERDIILKTVWLTDYLSTLPITTTTTTSTRPPPSVIRARPQLWRAPFEQRATRAVISGVGSNRDFPAQFKHLSFFLSFFLSWSIFRR